MDNPYATDDYWKDRAIEPTADPVDLRDGTRPWDEARAPEIDALARILMDAWAKAEGPDNLVVRHPASYVATFADMARAVIASRPAPTADPVDSQEKCATCRREEAHPGCIVRDPRGCRCPAPTADPVDRDQLIHDLALDLADARMQAYAAITCAEGLELENAKLKEEIARLRGSLGSK